MEWEGRGDNKLRMYTHILKCNWIFRSEVIISALSVLQKKKIRCDRAEQFLMVRRTLKWESVKGNYWIFMP